MRVCGRVGWGGGVFNECACVRVRVRACACVSVSLVNPETARIYTVWPLTEPGPSIVQHAAAPFHAVCPFKLKQLSLSLHQ